MMQTAKDNGFDVQGTCGGNMSCCTCHIILPKHIYDQIEISEDEEDILDYVENLTETSRLGCQIIATKEMEGITIKIPV